MVESFIRNIKKKLNINKKAELETILRDYEINLNAPSENGMCLLHLMIIEEDLDGIKLLLSLSDDQYKTKKADPNIIDTKFGWSPLVTALNQGPSGF
jgi:hypothetical protein